MQALGSMPRVPPLTIGRLCWRALLVVEGSVAIFPLGGTQGLAPY